MTIPTLKRIKITSELELMTWLAKNAGEYEKIMLVTHGDLTNPKHVSHQQVNEILVKFNWKPERRYTLNASLTGHVITKAI